MRGQTFHHFVDGAAVGLRPCSRITVPVPVPVAAVLPVVRGECVDLLTKEHSDKK